MFTPVQQTDRLPFSCPLLESVAGKRTLESRLGLPERPKKPLSPYFRFMSEMRSSVVAAHPQLRLTDVVKAIGVKWQTVDEKKKAAYQEEYKREQIVYLKQRAAYEAQLTEAQRGELQELKQQLAEQRSKNADRKRIRALGRPKRAMSPYLFWLSEKRTSLPRQEGETFRDWQRRCSALWQTLGETAKQPYFERSQAEFNKYSDELLLWEEKMVRQGNVDLVRSSMLVDPVEKLTKRDQRKTPKAERAPVESSATRARDE